MLCPKKTKREKIIILDILRAHISPTPKKYLLPLVDEKNRLLAGEEFLSKEEEIWVMQLPDAIQNIPLILDYEISLKNRKLSLGEKLFFLEKIQALFPEIELESIYKLLEFPYVKKNIIEWFLNFEKREEFLAKGLHSVREIEYLFTLEKHHFLDILLQNSLNPRDFRLALSMAFELALLNKLRLPEKNYSLNQWLVSLRYPEFFVAFQEYEKIMQKIEHPPFLKIQYPEFLEGNKIIIEIALKNTQQLEEALHFLSKQKDTISQMIAFLQQ